MKKMLVISFIMAMCICLTTVTISAALDSDLTDTVAASGDVNGDMYLDIKDVTLMQKYLTMIVDESGIIVENFDFNGDGIDDVADAAALQKYITKSAPIYVGTTDPTSTSTKQTDVITFPVVKV